MQHRRLALALAALLPAALAVAACHDDDTSSPTGTNNRTAVVRFVNATSDSGTALSVAVNGDVGAGNAGLGYGASTSCISVRTVNPGLSVTETATGSPPAAYATPTLTGNGRYTVVVLGTAGSESFKWLRDTLPAAASGQGRLRIVNATQLEAVSVFAGVPGDSTGPRPLVTGLGVAAATGFIGLPAGTLSLSLIPTDTAVRRKPLIVPLTVAAGQAQTLLIAAPAAPDTSRYRTFLVPTC